MAVRMSQSTPQVADVETMEPEGDLPRVRILITAVPNADLDAALAAVRRQVYEPEPELVVVGAEHDGVVSLGSLEEAISSTDSSFDYLWILHADARPRPDALAALVAESERHEASLAGSKLLRAGTMDELESVGGATDVFGEPYLGLDEGEIDLQQYDVVREVAFVQSASMLVRRDLAQGLKGLDTLLPPVAAGLDFSQRTRLAGGRVISVPSSEVYHQGRCGERGTGWREQAGRLRAILTAYSPLTLLWVLPYDVIVSIVDSLVSLLLLRWKPLVRHLYAWGWNIFHLPSTIRQRRRLKAVRAEGDEELFRFHAKGSVRLRLLGEELTSKALSMFDEDQALARSTRRAWGSPGIWGAVVSVLLLIVATRSVIFSGMPNAGFSFPFETSTVALDRWLGGWNDSGLGSPSAVHPFTGLAGALSWLWFGAQDAARVLLTLSLALAGVIGMGRLGGRVGLRGPGRYLAGIALLAGPGTAALTAKGSWLALGAAAMLPWVVRAAIVHPKDEGKSKLALAAWVVLLSTFLAFFSPLLVVVPVVFVAIWRVLGGDRGRVALGAVALVGGVAGIAFLMGDVGWVTDPSRALSAVVSSYWPLIIAVAGVPLIWAGQREASFGLAGGLIALGGLAAERFLYLGPGVEEALLITASFGAAVVVAAALDSFSLGAIRLVASIGAVAILVVSIGTLGNGRLGLVGGDENEALSFAVALSEGEDPGRILLASQDRESIPGEARSGPGFWYRVLDGDGATIDEVWQAEPLSGDVELRDALVAIASGSELRPGARLAPFAIDWIVLDGPSFRLDDALSAQLDLVPIPFDPESRIYQNDLSEPMAGPWLSSGTGFAGEAIEDRVIISMNFDSGWQPDPQPDGWRMTVDGSDGVASYSPAGTTRALSMATIAVLVMTILVIVFARRRRRS